MKIIGRVKRIKLMKETLLFSEYKDISDIKYNEYFIKKRISRIYLTFFLDIVK